MDRNQEIHIEKDFWDDFIVEAFEHIDAIESNAMDLEKNPDNMDIIHTMFRAFHTIKGLSGFVEHTIIQEIAHKTETMMDLCRKGELKVSTDIVNAILKSSDYIKQLCNDVESYKDGSLLDNIENLLVNLEELSSGTLFSNTPSEPVNEVVQNENAATEEPAIIENSEEGLDSFAKEISAVEEVVEQHEHEESNAEQVQQEETYQEPENNPVEEFSFESQVCDEPAAEFVQEEISEEPEQSFQEEVGTEQEIPLFDEGSIVESAETITFESTPDEQKVEEKIEEKPEEPVTAESIALKSFQSSVIEKLSADNRQKEEASKENVATKQASASEEYMKVANHKIDHLVDMMGELIINQALIEQYVGVNYSNDRQLVANMSGFLRITRELQNLSMSLRMVALKPTFQKLTRIARDTIQELHKDVEFVMSGEATEIDRAVAEKLLDPLVHMIKNAISHGIEENPDDRVPLGKDRRARVELNAYSKRGKIFIEVKDDGKGINTEIVYNKALEKGLVDTSRTYTDAEIREFIMMPGFSTAKVVDNISGRGVGMDVVKTQILKLGGKVEIQSALNQGSTFTLEVPVNHAIMNGTIIEMNEQHFVVPTVNVKEFLQPNDSQWIFTKSKRTMIKVRDNIIPIVPLSTFFKGIKEPERVPLVMVLELDQELRAVPIDNVINRQEVVVKPVGTEFSHLKYISGMSILGTGKVSLILDIDYLFRKEVNE